MAIGFSLLQAGPTIKRAQQEGEVLLLTERQALAEEAQLIASKETPQPGDELAARDAAEHLDCLRSPRSGKVLGKALVLPVY